MVDRLQLVVTYADHQIMYFPVYPDQGWHVDTAHRQIVVGKGIPRTMIPLDGVRYYAIEYVAQSANIGEHFRRLTPETRARMARENTEEAQNG